jgi:hypothetical protein
MFRPAVAIIRFYQIQNALRWCYTVCVTVCWWRDLVISIPFFIYGYCYDIGSVGNSWVIHEGGHAVLNLGIVRRFFQGLPEVTVCVFSVLLFSSLYASFRWFLLGCPCAPHWAWSSPVGAGGNTNRCVRELVHNSGTCGRHFCVVC